MGTAELQIRISPLSQSLRQILTHLPTTKTANMIIYKDILTGDEIISDSYDLKEVDGAVYEVDCAMITLGAVEVNTGANASAEEAEEGVEDGALQVNNVVNSFRLNSTLQSYVDSATGAVQSAIGSLTGNASDQNAGEAKKTKAELENDASQATLKAGNLTASSSGA